VPKAPTKPLIFISYSHKDREWVDYVRSHLAPAATHGVLTTWDDNQLQIGADWKGDIFSALDSCQVFILLVSRHSLVSKFILEHEIERIRARRQKQAVAFCPMVVTPCYLDAVDWLTSLNYHPKDGKALSELPEHVRDRTMEGIVAEITKIIVATAKQEKIEQETVATNGEALPRRAAVPSVVDYGRLPDTPYRNLLGREDELQTLDEAWAGKETNILSIVAWGGAGKTALANEWVKQLQAANYRGAQAVLGWSFYSQGTKERATSAEQFLNWALETLKIPIKSTSATAKGEALADAMTERRVLLILDGVEPLQHGPGGQEGQLKDQGLRAFLRRFASISPVNAHGIVLITSRLEIRDIQRWKASRGGPGAVSIVDLGRLSTEAGVALLRDNGIQGPDRLLRAAVEDFEGHALALTLLAGLLARRHHGDIQRRDRVGPLMRTTDPRGHGHAHRVMQAYETEWLKDEPTLSAIMYLIGLFDRPATADCLQALRRQPAIKELTETLISLSSESWADALFTLREVRLLDREDPHAPGAVDAHPLVREWFGERLRELNLHAWRAAHGRLYEHLRDVTIEGTLPTLESLGPLYQAIGHGCRGGQYAEALDAIYINRICQRRHDGSIEYYASRRLGVIGTNLAAISWFFERPYETPVRALSQGAQAWVLGEAGYYLEAQGRFTEALSTMEVTTERYEALNDWRNAAIQAANLSEAELLLGRIEAAIRTAQRAVAFGDRSAVLFHKMNAWRNLAQALEAAGDRAGSVNAFVEAEQFQRESQPRFSILYSLAGYMYCDLFIAQGDWVQARDRARQILEWEDEKDPLADRGLVRLALARAGLGLALASKKTEHSASSTRVDMRTIESWLDEAVDNFVAAGIRWHLPRGLLARAAFRRAVGDLSGACRDLDDVLDVAEFGPLRLFLCDMYLERARVAFARVEGFSPLNELGNNNPSIQTEPDAVEAERLREHATLNLNQARKLIQECGYHRRDEEVSELEAVLARQRKFADLPPRV
jgi:tetratricopeptide (TPR) repeat protein